MREVFGRPIEKKSIGLSDSSIFEIFGTSASTLSGPAIGPDTAMKVPAVRLGEIARLFNVPVTMLQDLSAGIKSNVEQQNLQFLGERRPITMEGFKTAWRRYKGEAKVENFRFHDTRHTAATRTLRTGNLKVVQQMLGHEDIATTAKYAHAMLDDMRAAMEAANSIPNSIPAAKNASK